MARRVRGAILAVLSAVSVAACNGGGPVGIGPSIAVVYGSVTDDAGTGVAGTAIRIFPYCDEIPDDDVPVGETVSGGDGGYAATLRWAHVSEFKTCATLVATPPPETGLHEKAISGIAVTVRGGIPGEPVDSARVDVVLSPAS